jgi:hypothetical protein
VKDRPVEDNRRRCCLALVGKRFLASLSDERRTAVRELPGYTSYDFVGVAETIVRRG